MTDDSDFYAARKPIAILPEDIERNALRLSMTERQWEAYVSHGQLPQPLPSSVDPCRACAGTGERPYYETPSGPARWDTCITCHGTGGR